MDFLARNVADLKMQGTWALKVTKMALFQSERINNAHFGDQNEIPKWETKSSTTFFSGIGEPIGGTSVSIGSW